MSELKLVLPVSQAVTLTSDEITRLLSTRNGNAALLYLYLLQQNGTVSHAEIMRVFNWGAEQLDAAANALGRTGLIELSAIPSSVPAPVTHRPEAPPEREIPEYTANDIVREMEGNESFRLLINEAQRRLGKILSSADLAILFGLYDYVGLPVEVLYLLINHCVEESHRRYGANRNPTMRQIEKEGYLWARQDIDTEERAASHIKHLIDRRSDIVRTMSILQISARAPSRSEEKYIAAWLEMGFGAEAIELAYDKTVLKCKELNWNYINSILKNWNQKNLHTLAEIEAGDYSVSGKRPPADPAEGKSRRKDIDQMKNYLKTLKEQES